MKAKFFLLGFCVLALASCSIDETISVNDSNAISFKATTATRATAVTTNDINAFTVWAWERVDGTPEFMDGVEAARSGDSNTFATSHTYYWPGAALDFYAFIPAATVEADGSTEYARFGGEITPSAEVIEGAGTYEYSGYVANATITSQSDIKVDMHVPTNAAEGIDLGYAATLGQSSGMVGLNFRHALSQVAFKAMNGNADWTVDIQGVTLCGIYKEGTCTLPEFDEAGTTEHNSTTAAKLEWTVGDVQGRFNAGIVETTFEGTSSASESITAENGALMLIPQTVAAWDPVSDPTNTALGAYIRINCKVTDGDEQIWPNYNEADETYVLPEYAEITVPFDVDWEEGSLYSYTIVFGEGLGYYAPDDENPDLEGTPVLVPIRFTVDIDDFGNLDEVDVSTETDGGYDPASLVLEYTVTSDGTEISLPLGEIDNDGNEYAIDCTVDWGDGNEVETVTGSFPSHTYSEAGTYTVIINGKVELLNSWDYDSKKSIGGVECLTAVKQWGDTGLQSMDGAFRACSSLSSLPEGHGPFSAVKSFYYAFAYCSSLTTVPEDMFSDCTAVQDFGCIFYGCSSLESVPVGLFDDSKSVLYFDDSFRSCSKLKGESPYTEINVDGTPVKVHLYERENYPEYFTAPTAYTRCFRSCTGLDDYEDIPSGWK